MAIYFFKTKSYHKLEKILMTLYDKRRSS